MVSCDRSEASAALAGALKPIDSQGKVGGTTCALSTGGSKPICRRTIHFGALFHCGHSCEYSIHRHCALAVNSCYGGRAGWLQRGYSTVRTIHCACTAVKSRPQYVHRSSCRTCNATCTAAAVQPCTTACDASYATHAAHQHTKCSTRAQLNSRVNTLAEDTRAFECIAMAVRQSHGKAQQCRGKRRAMGRGRVGRGGAEGGGRGQGGGRGGGRR
jgi:uncharacterized membrane protein YgcG